MSMMRAALWKGAGKMEIAEMPKPVPGDGEVLLKVCAVGVCGTDLAIYSGKFNPDRAKPPLAPGHEFTGIIEELGGNVGGFSVGDFVAAYPLVFCGECYPCRNGMPHVCAHLKLLGIDSHGGMAEYVAVSAEKLFRLPKDMPPEISGLVEPCSVALHDVRRSGFRAGDSALVIGGGPIGYLIAEVLRNSGVNGLLVSEISDARRGLLDRHGINTASPLEEDFKTKLSDCFGGGGPRFVFEVTGVDPGYQSAIDLAGIGATIVQVGLPHGKSSLNLGKVNFAELTIVGVRVQEPVDFAGAIHLLGSGLINTDGFVSVHSLEETPAVFAELASGKSDLIKPVIRIG